MKRIECAGTQKKSDGWKILKVNVEENYVNIYILMALSLQDEIYHAKDIIPVNCDALT